MGEAKMSNAPTGTRADDAFAQMFTMNAAEEINYRYLYRHQARIQTQK
jgi:hypothetical protein